MIIEVNDAEFQEKVLNSDKLVLVDFWAEWCGPCKLVGPILDELAEDYADQIVVAKMDVDNNPETPMKYGIRNIPTVLYVKGGEVVDKQVGAVQKGTYSGKVDAAL